jgi:hypothetical protein
VRSRFASFLVFFSVISALLALVHRYLYVRLVADAALGPVIEHRSAVAFASLAVALPCGMVAMRLLPRAAAQPVAWLTYAWMGLLTLLLFGLLGSEVVRGGIHLYATITGAPFDAARSLGYRGRSRLPSASPHPRSPSLARRARSGRSAFGAST